MFVSHPSSCPPRRQRLVAWMFGVAVAVAVTLAPSLEAQAAEPELGTTAFGIPRASWYTPPLQLQLQPERARLMLILPTEWMPAADLGVLSTLGFASMPSAPGKQWVFYQRRSMTTATVGACVRVQVTAPSHSIDFRLRLMPRAAIAVLRFDPTGRLH